MREVYLELVQQLLRKYPDAWVKAKRYTGSLRDHKVCRKVGGKVIVLADWSRFKVIAETFYWIMSEYMINGWSMHILHMGLVYPLEVKANPRTMVTDWSATMRYCKENNLPLTYTNMIFYTRDTYCMMKWTDRGRYKFTTSGHTRHGTGLKDRFSAALMENKQLSMNYKKDMR